MKIITVFIFIAVCLTSCNRQLTKNNWQSNIITDTVATAPLSEIMAGTVVKTSKPFKLNNTKCYWKHQIINNEEIIIQLWNSATNKILLEYGDVIYYPRDYETNNYFEEINRESFEDVNFDGFTDILIRSYTNNPMNDRVNVYLYNSQTKVYDSTDDLSDNHVELIDKKNRKFITSNEYRFGKDSTIHYFDTRGSINFTELFSEYRMVEDTTWIQVKTYTKTINGETVIERTTNDTIKWE